ncbi:MAG: hypothetical protein IKS71_00280 [Bacteroidales bacterium]|nr:hypothetical protein [Bacteroidales bacterium]
MKRVITIAALLVASLQVSAQESGFDKFLKQIWFPTEFGYSLPVGQGMNSGLVTRIAVEWRQEDQSGLCASVNFDTRYNSYIDRTPAGTNLTGGDVDFNDLYIGAGYRKQLSLGFTAAIF